MTKLDSNAAWKEASSQVSANRDVFLALAGVFFVVPSLALTVIGGEPEFVPGMQPEQITAALVAFLTGAWWLIALNLILQVSGMLAILTLMRDRTRPTVREAITGALRGLLPYLGAVLLLVLAFGLVGGLAIAIGGAVTPALAVVALLLVTGFWLYANIRLILIAPVVAVEGTRNPLTVLRRSWALTRGQFWRIFGFLALVVILFVVVLGVVSLLFGVVLAIFTSGETQRVLGALLSSTMTAILLVYLTGIYSAIHRQLAGPGKAGLAETFG